MRALVLLVEEDRHTCRTICDMLEALGYRALGVNSFERAVKVMIGIGFDALIIPAHYPTSHELSHAATAKTMQPNIKVILVSPESLTQDLSASADALIVKPFLVKSLGDALIAVLQKLR